MQGPFFDLSKQQPQKEGRSSFSNILSQVLAGTLMGAGQALGGPSFTDILQQQVLLEDIRLKEQ